MLRNIYTDLEKNPFSFLGALFTKFTEPLVIDGGVLSTLMNT